MEKKKTKAEWDKIKWENNLGIQIGACVNKAVDLAIADKDLRPDTIRTWVAVLYEIGTKYKKQILKNQEPKPLTEEDFKRAKEKYEKIEEVERQKEVVGLQDANYEANEVAEEDNKSRVPF